MKAFIFAAGIGSRLKPWTDHHPKALAEINGRPVLDINIAKLQALPQVDEVIVNVHHFPQQIKDFISERQPFYEKPVVVSDETERLLDTGGAIGNALSVLDNDSALVHNADILTDVDLEAMIKHHIKLGNDVTLLAMDRKTSRKLLFDKTGKLRGWYNRATSQTIPDGIDPDHYFQLGFGGIHIISPAVYPLIVDYREFIGSPVFSIIKFYLWAMDKLNISYFCPDTSYRWIDIGRPESLHEAQKLFGNEQ